MTILLRDLCFLNSVSQCMISRTNLSTEQIKSISCAKSSFQNLDGKKFVFDTIPFLIQKIFLIPHFIIAPDKY